MPPAPIGTTRSIVGRAKNKLARVTRQGLLRAASAVAPDRTVTLFLDRPLTICLPFRDAAQLGQQLARVPVLKALERDFGPATFVFVTDLADDPEPGSELDTALRAASAARVPDFRSLVSFLAGAQFHVVLADEESASFESLAGWCECFHVNHFRHAEDLLRALTERGPLALTGPYAAAYAVHKSLWLNVMGNQYAFTEPLDWNIVKELPRKFITLRQSAKVDAHPISELSGPLNRIERQRAVGRLYKEFLQGDAVVDIGCDVRGIEESVGPHTRYHGIDMHGKPDIVLNLDRDELPFGEKSVDTVVCVEALEHLQRMHQVFDNILAISRRHVICSLPVEAAYTGNKLVDAMGGVFSFATPLAPVFDRHQWVGSVSDNLDLVYYRSALGGFSIRQIDLFYMPRRGSADAREPVLRSFHHGRVAELNRRVGLLMFVLERKGQ